MGFRRGRLPATLSTRCVGDAVARHADPTPMLPPTRPRNAPLAGPPLMSIDLRLLTMLASRVPRQRLMGSLERLTIRSANSIYPDLIYDGRVAIKTHAFVEDAKKARAAGAISTRRQAQRRWAPPEGCSCGFAAPDPAGDQACTRATRRDARGGGSRQHAATIAVQGRA